ncbi:phosphatidate phosphatase LPIN isoform X2 [Rhodnius prolixus]|uniref:phosphatidate phosphatase LPIN isoform X2 n=1 Tax=Rhodnius prolixus TaxID=13249 RepID=UPI003D18C64D
MNYLGKVINNFKYIYNDINAATLTGAIDVVVVEQPDGTFTCSPFHVRFGKMGVLRSKEKIVDIEINGEPVDIHMKLGESGEAFFVEEVELGEGEEDFIPPHLACSPIPPDGDRFNSSEEWRDYNDEPAILNENEPPSLSVTAVTSNTPKTFRAETVEEEDGDIARKLSTNEFRPIVGQHSETSLSSQESTTTDFTKEDSPSADERLSTANNKRRRRKKSTKKKGSLKRNSTGNIVQQLSVVGAVAPPVDDKGSDEGGIFQIEDLDNTIPQPAILEKEEIKEDLNSTQQSAVERDIHFFSDTELTPGSRCLEDGVERVSEDSFQLLDASSVIGAFPRDFAPIQSDSEFETKRLGGVGGEAVHQVTAVDEQPQSWRWGELPTSNTDDSKQESQRWMLQNMLGFMKKTKHIRHKTESEGIYLSELNSDDPEMASLYFPSAYKQTNTSTQAEFTTESVVREEDAESGNGPSLPQSPHSVEGAICGPKSIDSDFDSNKWCPEDVALSLCGSSATPEQFQEHTISYKDFCLDPSLLTNPKLVVKIDGKLYNWRVAAPMLVSLFFFHKNLPQEVISRLCEGADGVENEEKGKQSKKPYSSWFNWSRANQSQQQQQQQQGPSTLSDVKVDLIKEPVEIMELPQVPQPVRPDSISAEVSSTGGVNPLDLSTDSRKDEETLEAATPDYNSDKYRKTLRLTSQQIASLKLHPGANEAEFSVTTAYQGTTKCKCFLFCWRYDDKIVVSDIDGTITKSDVLGHILPIVGKDWAQSGVAKLFTKIKDNGYKLLYLSARAIGQSRLTRDYLRSIKQEDLGLPEGPMLLNPTSLLNAFHTEVIEKKPEEFKISCLKDIQALFPSHIKPFYAGYGNKINDVWAYQAVGIPIFRIFTINHRGELKHELTETFQSTYTNMSQLVDQMFPASKPFSSEDFSQFVYWREPIIDIMEELSSQKP